MNGRVAVSLLSQPPTEKERRYLQTLRRDVLFENMLAALGKALTAKQVLRFKGTTEVKDFQKWVDALERYFDTHAIHNAALRGVFAFETFVDHCYGLVACTSSTADYPYLVF